MNMGGVFVPVFSAGSILVFPGAFVPDEEEVFLELFPHPEMGAFLPLDDVAGKLLPVLVGDGVDAEFFEEGFELFFATGFLHLPDPIALPL